MGRLLSGLAAGAIFVLVPLYTTEIADEKSRGVLGSFFIFSINLGTLLMFVTGAYTSYRVNALIMMVLPIVFLVTFYLVNPETPQYLFKKGKVQEAEKCLKFLRGVSKAQQTPESVKNELLMISQRIEENAERGNFSILEELSEFSHYVFSFYLLNKPRENFPTFCAREQVTEVRDAVCSLALHSLLYNSFAAVLSSSTTQLIFSSKLARVFRLTIRQSSLR